MMPRTYATFATGTLRGRYGAYAVALAIATDAATAAGYTVPAEPLSLSIVSVDGPAYDTPTGSDGPLGIGMMGASLTLTLADPDEAVRSVLTLGATDASALRLTLSGPDGLGGTLTFGAQYVPTDTDDTLAPLVYPSGDVVTEWACGLGPAEDVPAGEVYGMPLAVLAALTRATERPGVMRLSPVRYADDEAFPDAAAYVWEGPLEYGFLPPFLTYGYNRATGSRLADSDTLADQLDAVCRAYTAVAYLSLRQATPEWHVVPRWALGLDLADATTLPAATAGAVPGDVRDARTYPATRAGRTVTVPGTWTADGRRARRPPPREVAVRLPEGALLNADPGVADEDQWETTGSPTFGYTSSAPYVGHFAQLPEGAAITQSLGGVAPPGRMLVRVGGVGVLRARVVLDTGTETLYATGSGWSTTPTTVTLSAELDNDNNPAPSSPGGRWRRLLTAPLPAAGALSVAVVGGPVTDSITATVHRVEVNLADSAGAIIYRYAAATGGVYATGQPAEIPVPAGVTASGTVVSSLPTPWLAEPATVVYPDHTTAVAATRVAQTTGPDGRPLWVFEAEVPGLVGPDTRLVFHGAGIGPVCAGFSGGAPDPKTGLTRGTWTEIAGADADGLADPATSDAALAARTILGRPALDTSDV